MTTSTFLRWLWVAIATQLAGRILDLRWHLTHDEFEGTAQQFEAYWLLWIGVLGTLVVGLVALRERPADVSRPGVGFLVTATVAYSGIAIWHFIEHANGNDPSLAHVLLGVTQLAMVVTAAVLTLGMLRQRRSRTAPAG